MGGFAGFAGFAPLSGTNSAPSTTSFNASSAAGGTTFIPKAKQAAMGVSGNFPALGTTGSAQAEKKKDENADPCQGKRKEFFIYE